VREYQGERQTVTVVPGGYVWRGATYPSLSTVARAITGTAWNGPRFFGLRTSANHRQDIEPEQVNGHVGNPDAGSQGGRGIPKAARKLQRSKKAQRK
jgi:hypothetical protein